MVDRLTADLFRLDYGLQTCTVAPPIGIDTVATRVLLEYQVYLLLASNNRGKQIFTPANIHFKILAANVSIDFSPHRILEYSSEAIRPIYAQSGSYVELRTSNLSSLGCVLSI